MKLEKVTIVLLVIINLSLLTLFGSGLFNQVPGQVVVHDLKLDHLEPVFGDSQELVGDTGTLFVFFHADSSCQCLDDWSNWVKTNNDNPKDLRVVGIFNSKDIQKFEQFASGVSLPFPIFRDPNYTLHRQLRVTPGQIVKVLVDYHGRIVYSDSDEVSERSQKDFMRRLNEHIDRLNN